MTAGAPPGVRERGNGPRLPASGHRVARLSLPGTGPRLVRPAAHERLSGSFPADGVAVLLCVHNAWP